MIDAAPPQLVVGLDLSLTGTGIAFHDGTVRKVDGSKTSGMERVDMIVTEIGKALHLARAEHDGEPKVIIEGYSYASANQAHQLGELGGVVRHLLWRASVPYAVVPPNSVKKLATGSGGAGKIEVVVAARERLGYVGHNDNEADSLWVRAFGLALLGALPCQLPKTHLIALDRFTGSDPFIVGSGRS